jgi:hypothetical protein
LHFEVVRIALRDTVVGADFDEKSTVEVEVRFEDRVEALSSATGMKALPESLLAPRKQLPEILEPLA